MKNKKLFALLTLSLIFLNLVTILAFENTINLEKYIVEYSYEKVSPGEQFNLDIKITSNQERKNQGIGFELIETPLFKVVGEKNIEIGSMNYKESITNNFKINVENKVIFEENELSFIIKDDSGEYLEKFKININLDNANIIINNISSDPKKIISGQNKIILNIDLENIGEESAKNLYAKLILPEGFSAKDSYSNIYRIDEIKPSKKEVATFLISSQESLISKSYFANLMLNYEVEGKQKTSYLKLELPVKSSPEFVIISTSPSRLIIGKENNLKILLQNIGNEKGQETSIRLIEKSSQPFKFRNRNVELGTISSFQTGTATFNFLTNSQASPGQYFIEAQIKTYLDNEEIIYKKTIPVFLIEEESHLFLYLSLILIVLVLVLLYFFVKRKFLESNKNN